MCASDVEVGRTHRGHDSGASAGTADFPGGVDETDQCTGDDERSEKNPTDKCSDMWSTAYRTRQATVGHKQGSTAEKR